MPRDSLLAVFTITALFQFGCSEEGTAGPNAFPGSADAAPGVTGGSGAAPGRGGSGDGGASGAAAGGATAGGDRGDGGSSGNSGSGGLGMGGLTDSGSAGAGGSVVGAGGSAVGAGGSAVGGAAGSGGLIGSGGTGGDDPMDGAAGSGGSEPNDDRCDVAIYDPNMPPGVLPMSGDLGTHDPTVIEQNGVFYLYQTGRQLPGKRSTDLASWSGAPAALGGSNPAWIGQQVPAATDLWAPDLSYFGGQYHLYYSASTFGVNLSCMGHATRASMAAGGWTDHGSIVCSRPRSGSSPGDDYNAIDPNVVVDQDGTPWLSFGSFWDGIKMVQLDQNGARANGDLHSLASRGGGAIEAPVIVRRCGFYYLFVSFDRCCDGANSTYNIRVGRSENVLGPYLDRNGTPMREGGGTLLLEGSGSWAATGHNFVFFSGSRAYNVYHAYPTNGSYARLRVADLVWDAQGWPISGGP